VDDIPGSLAACVRQVRPADPDAVRKGLTCLARPAANATAPEPRLRCPASAKPCRLCGGASEVADAFKRRRTLACPCAGTKVPRRALPGRADRLPALHFPAFERRLDLVKSERRDHQE
jgi:hypothetical protein